MQFTAKDTFATLLKFLAIALMLFGADHRFKHTTAPQHISPIEISLATPDGHGAVYKRDAITRQYWQPQSSHEAPSSVHLAANCTLYQMAVHHLDARPVFSAPALMRASDIINTSSYILKRPANAFNARAPPHTLLIA